MQIRAEYCGAPAPTKKVWSSEGGAIVRYIVIYVHPRASANICA